ncbi:MAG: DUF2203 domain-containing protein [Pirellulales bacterium]|jgi:hypothetical protein|nr:DUF2203 domain-containing protein [Pirellulales bacterium]
MAGSRHEGGSENPFQGRKVFTVEQANAALPLVRAIAGDLAELARDVIARRERVKAILAMRERMGDRRSSELYDEEVALVEEELERDIRRLQEYVEELRELGVEPKGATEGLVDFPAMMDGRPVYLCWKVGEPEVLYWHEIDAGFPGRQPLYADSGVAGSDAADAADPNDPPAK